MHAILSSSGEAGTRYTTGFKTNSSLVASPWSGLKKADKLVYEVSSSGTPLNKRCSLVLPLSSHFPARYVWYFTLPFRQYVVIWALPKLYFAEHAVQLNKCIPTKGSQFYVTLAVVENNQNPG